MTFTIALAPGVCRFDVLWNRALRVDDTDYRCIDNLHYFKGLRTMLMARGYTVYHMRVGWASGVDMRGNDLKQGLRRLLDQTGANKSI